MKGKVKLKVQVKLKDDLVNKDWPGRHKCKQGCQTCRSKIDTNLLSSSNSINPDMTTVKSLISSLSIVREQKGSKSPGSSLWSIRTTFTIAINALCLQLFPPEQNGNINRILYIYRTGNNEQEQNNYSKPPEIALKRVNCTIGGIFQRLSLTSPVHHITLRSLLLIW